MQGLKVQRCIKSILWLVVSMVFTSGGDNTAGAAPGEVLCQQKISDLEGNFEGMLVNFEQLVDLAT